MIPISFFREEFSKAVKTTVESIRQLGKELEKMNVKNPYQHGFERGVADVRKSESYHETGDVIQTLIDELGRPAVFQMFGLEGIEGGPEWARKWLGAVAQYRKGHKNGVRRELALRNKQVPQEGPTLESVRSIGFHVRVKHERVVDCRLDLEKLDGPPYEGRHLFLDKKVKVENPRGGRTLVSVEANYHDVSVIFIGEANCHENDNYQKHIGVRLALQRAVNTMADAGLGVGAQPLFQFWLYDDKEFVKGRAMVNASTQNDAQSKLDSRFRHGSDERTLKFRLVSIHPGNWLSLNPQWNVRQNGEKLVRIY